MIIIMYPIRHLVKNVSNVYKDIIIMYIIIETCY